MARNRSQVIREDKNEYIQSVSLFTSRNWHWCRAQRRQTKSCAADLVRGQCSLGTGREPGVTFNFEQQRDRLYSLPKCEKGCFCHSYGQLKKVRIMSPTCDKMIAVNAFQGSVLFFTGSNEL